MEVIDQNLEGSATGAMQAGHKKSGSAFAKPPSSKRLTRQTEVELLLLNSLFFGHLLLRCSLSRLVRESSLGSSEFRNRDAERATAYVVESSAVTELDGLRVTAVLTTDTAPPQSQPALMSFVALSKNGS